MADTNFQTAAADGGLVTDIMQVGAAGSRIKKTKLYTPSLSPALIAANTTAEQTFAVPGLRVATDVVIGVSKPTAQAGIGIVGWRVSADDTLAITFSNNTAGGLTPTAAQTYSVVAITT